MPSAPGNASSAVRYNDNWYWVDRDFRSKRIISFLKVLMTLAEKDDKGPAPVVTMPAN